MANEKILTISQVNFTGKWVEFWFHEEKRHFPDYDKETLKPTGDEIETWVHSSKAYKLWDLIAKYDLEKRVHNKGFPGIKTKWQESKYKTHWELIDLVVGENT